MERSVSRWEGNGQAGRPAEPYETGSTPDSSAPEILIAEDNRDMRELLCFLLGREYRVRATRNGREALESLRDSHPDLVLTDVMMPEMSGTELCREIKSDPETRAIPVVLVTSKAEREMKIEGLELGADDYVTKPFHHRELLARIRSLVRQHRLGAELARQNVALASALEELKQAEGMLIQSERLAAVGELAAGIAHEVNNPVNFATNALRALHTSVEEVCAMVEKVGELDWSDALKLRAQLETFQAARDEFDVAAMSGTMAELIDIASDGLERTSQLVSDLRDFAAPGRGERSRVDLRRGVETTVQLSRGQFLAANARVEIAIPDDLVSVQGDPGALNQVFLNLLKNAAEAMAGRGGVLCVRAAVEPGFVHLRFEDQGPGIAPETLDKLFQPFFTTKEAGQGTGLGLSMSRQIAHAHGGDLRVESQIGVGTTFILTLPVSDRTEGLADAA
jgi:signal transduction histidine kinase